MIQLLRALLAALMGLLLGFVTPLPAVAAPSLLAAPHVHDATFTPPELPYPAAERGPPTASAMPTAHDADGLRTRGASARSAGATPHAATSYDDPTGFVQVTQATGTTEERAQSDDGALTALAPRDVVANAATRADIAGARFAQRPYSGMFSSGGRFAGRGIDDVAGSLRSGALSPKDVPVDVIVRDGNSLILKTRSSRALLRAGVPRSSWNVIDRTGQAFCEAGLTGQLTRNGLTNYGTELP